MTIEELLKAAEDRMRDSEYVTESFEITIDTRDPASLENARLAAQTFSVGAQLYATQSLACSQLAIARMQYDNWLFTKAWNKMMGMQQEPPQ